MAKKKVKSYVNTNVSVQGKKYSVKYDRTELTRTKKTELIISEIQIGKKEETTYRKGFEDFEKEATRTKAGKDDNGKEFKKGDKYIVIEKKEVDIPVITEVPSYDLKEVRKEMLYFIPFSFQIVEIVQNMMRKTKK